MQLISKTNKGIRFFSYGLFIFIVNYAWVVPLKYKSGIAITNES